MKIGEIIEETKEVEKWILEKGLCLDCVEENGKHKFYCRKLREKEVVGRRNSGNETN